MLRRALFSLLLLLPGCPGPEVAVDAPVGMDAPPMDAAPVDGGLDSAGADVPFEDDASMSLDTPPGDAPMSLDTPPAGDAGTDAGACIPEGMTCAGATSPCCAPATCLLGFVCAIQPDAGPTPDAGRDAGSDAGRDPGSDAGRDAGSDADAGRDAGSDAGRDAPTCGGLGASCGPMAPCCGGVCSGSPSGTCALCGVLRDRCSPTEPCCGDYTCGDYTCSPGPTGFCI